MGIKRKLKFEIYRGQIKSWDSLFQEAAEFASRIGEENVCNVTTSCDHSDSLVTVWYWE